MTVQSLNPDSQCSASISCYLDRLPRFHLCVWTLQSCCCSGLTLSASSIFLDASIEHRFVVPGLDHATALKLVSELNRLAGWDDEIAAWQARRLASQKRAGQHGDAALLGESVGLTNPRGLL